MTKAVEEMTEEELTRLLDEKRAERWRIIFASLITDTAEQSAKEAGLDYQINMKIKVKFAVLCALGVFAKGANGASEEHARASYEVWDLPETGLVRSPSRRRLERTGNCRFPLTAFPHVRRRSWGPAPAL